MLNCRSLRGDGTWGAKTVINRIGATTLIALLLAPAAHGGLFQDIYRGLGILATPSGSPVTPAGPGGLSNGNRFGRLRIVPNAVGNGYDLEFNRIFGTDAVGRPEILDLGAFELEVNGAISSTVGFTNRRFGMDNFLKRGLLIGEADLFVNNLNYSLRAKTGLQDIALVGTLNGANSIELNALGFYRADITLSNTNSSLIANGQVIDGDADTDFDIGPIRIKGNIYFDMMVYAMASLGFDTSGLEQIFPASPIDVITDQLRQTFERQTQVLGEVIDAEGLAATGVGQDFDIVLTPSGDAMAAGSSDLQRQAANIPEPTTLALLLGGAFIAARRRG